MAKHNRTALDRRFEVAQRAAHEAGVIAREALARPLRVSKKGPQDFVTDADRRAERAVLRCLKDEFPSDPYLGEEGGGEATLDGWFIDPIDGTTNFLHGIPHFCVSIAYLSAGLPELGVVYDPQCGEVYSAQRKKGAFLNGKRLMVRPTKTLSGSLIALGYSRRTAVAPFGRLITRLIQKGGEFRRSGSAALALCYVAAGRFDAYYEAVLNPWDAAAGLLLVEEAGGRVNRFFERGRAPGGPVLASTPRLFRPLEGLLENRPKR